MRDPGKVVYVHSHWRHLPGAAAAATGLAVSGGWSWLAGAAVAALPIVGVAVVGLAGLGLAAAAVSDALTPEAEKRRLQAEREAREAERRRIEAERRRREAFAARVMGGALFLLVVLVSAACCAFGYK
jgi:hypothetical protein